jgi:hypothetical protein
MSELLPSSYLRAPPPPPRPTLPSTRPLLAPPPPPPRAALRATGRPIVLTRRGRAGQCAVLPAGRVRQRQACGRMHLSPRGLAWTQPYLKGGVEGVGGGWGVCDQHYSLVGRGQHEPNEELQKAYDCCYSPKSIFRPTQVLARHVSYLRGPTCASR